MLEKMVMEMNKGESMVLRRIISQRKMGMIQEMVEHLGQMM